MLELFRVPAALLPVVKDTADDYGSTSAALLGKALPICAVIGDQQAALMGQGCIHAGEMKATYGTGCFMLLNTGDVRPVSRARLLTTVAVRIGGVASFALEGSIFIAGAAFQWLTEGLGVSGGPKAIEALAETARPDHGVVVVPAFTGLGAPWWDADARGAILGLTRDSGLAEIAAATYDACAFQTRDLIEAMQADAPDCLGERAELRIDGGMASSDWFTHRLCDLTGVPVRRSEFHEMTAFGAALLAGVGAGVYPSLVAAVASRPSSQQTVPVMDKPSRDAAYARWTQAVPRVRSRS
jgi:glycerol kinase